MKISKILIKRLAPNKGHIGFCSVVIDEWLYLGNIAIFTRLNKEPNIRLVFPEKKVGEKKLQIFYPLSSSEYFQLEKAIFDKLQEI